MVVPEEAKLVFWPQHASLSADQPGDVSVAATIVHTELLGSTLRYGVRVGTAEVPIDTFFQTGEAVRRPGDTVSVGLSLLSPLWLTP